MSPSPDAPTNTAPPAGWHPDPLGRVAFRWWDGERWSPYGSVDGTDVVVDTDGSLPSVAPSTPDSRRSLALVASLAMLAAIAACAIWRAGPDEGTDTSDLGASAPAVAPGDGAPPGASDDPAEPLAPPTSGAATDDDPTDDPYLDERESPWPVSGEPVKVVYLVETSRGDEWKETIASDPPRSIHRGPQLTMFNDGTDVVRCIEDDCVRLDDELTEPVDYLDSRISFSPPSELPDPSSRRIAGREAICAPDVGLGTTCWDTQTGILLLLDPGDEAMEPSAFTSTRITATYLGPPDESDFELPSEPRPPEDP